MKTAIVVIDMQNDFVTGSLGTREAAEVLPRIRDFLAETRHPLRPPMSSSLRTRILKTISKRRKDGIFQFLTALRAAAAGISARS